MATISGHGDSQHLPLHSLPANMNVGLVFLLPIFAKHVYLILGKYFCCVRNSVGQLSPLSLSKAPSHCLFASIVLAENPIPLLIATPWYSLFSLAAFRTSYLWCSPVSLLSASWLTSCAGFLLLGLCLLGAASSPSIYSPSKRQPVRSSAYCLCADHCNTHQP